MYTWVYFCSEICTDGFYAIKYVLMGKILLNMYEWVLDKNCSSLFQFIFWLTRWLSVERVSCFGVLPIFTIFIFTKLKFLATGEAQTNAAYNMPARSFFHQNLILFRLRTIALPGNVRNTLNLKNLYCRVKSRIYVIRAQLVNYTGFFY